MRTSLQRMKGIAATPEVAAVNFEPGFIDDNKYKMTKEIEIRLATDSTRTPIISLLKSENLPTEDLPQGLGNFLAAFHQNELVGTIGLEKYGNCGLLRSLVVNAKYRNEHVAEKLVHKLETQALELGINCIYLLTETASGYFKKKGYQEVNRADVPNVLHESSEFSHVCPKSAIVMNKVL